MTNFIKNYGISAVLILGACALGIFNFGFFGYHFTNIALFVFTATVYMMFHTPKLWAIVKQLPIKLFNWIKSLFKK